MEELVGAVPAAEHGGIRERTDGAVVPAADDQQQELQQQEEEKQEAKENKTSKTKSTTINRNRSPTSTTPGREKKEKKSPQPQPLAVPDALGTPLVSSTSPLGETDNDDDNSLSSRFDQQKMVSSDSLPTDFSSTASPAASTGAAQRSSVVVVETPTPTRSGSSSGQQEQGENDTGLVVAATAGGGGPEGSPTVNSATGSPLPPKGILKKSAFVVPSEQVVADMDEIDGATDDERPTSARKKGGLRKKKGASTPRGGPSTPRGKKGKGASGKQQHPGVVVTTTTATKPLVVVRQTKPKVDPFAHVTASVDVLASRRPPPPPRLDEQYPPTVVLAPDEVLMFLRQGMHLFQDIYMLFPRPTTDTTPQDETSRDFLAPFPSFVEFTVESFLLRIGARRATVTSSGEKRSSTRDFSSIRKFILYLSECLRQTPLPPDPNAKHRTISKLENKVRSHLDRIGEIYPPVEWLLCTGALGSAPGLTMAVDSEGATPGCQQTTSSHSAFLYPEESGTMIFSPNVSSGAASLGGSTNAELGGSGASAVYRALSSGVFSTLSALVASPSGASVISGSPDGSFRHSGRESSPDRQLRRRQQRAASPVAHQSPTATAAAVSVKSPAKTERSNATPEKTPRGGGQKKKKKKDVQDELFLVPDSSALSPLTAEALTGYDEGESLSPVGHHALPPSSKHSASPTAVGAGHHPHLHHPEAHPRPSLPPIDLLYRPIVWQTLGAEMEGSSQSGAEMQLQLVVSSQEDEEQQEEEDDSGDGTKKLQKADTASFGQEIMTAVVVPTPSSSASVGAGAPAAGATATPSPAVLLSATQPTAHNLADWTLADLQLLFAVQFRPIPLPRLVRILEDLLLSIKETLSDAAYFETHGPVKGANRANVGDQQEVRAVSTFSLRKLAVTPGTVKPIRDFNSFSNASQSVVVQPTPGGGTQNHPWKVPVRRSSTGETQLLVPPRPTTGPGLGGSLLLPSSILPHTALSFTPDERGSRPTTSSTLRPPVSSAKPRNLPFGTVINIGVAEEKTPCLGGQLEEDQEHSLFAHRAVDRVRKAIRLRKAENRSQTVAQVVDEEHHEDYKLGIVTAQQHEQWEREKTASLFQGQPKAEPKQQRDSLNFAAPEDDSRQKTTQQKQTRNSVDGSFLVYEGEPLSRPSSALTVVTQTLVPQLQHPGAGVLPCVSDSSMRIREVTPSTSEDIRAGRRATTNMSVATAQVQSGEKRDMAGSHPLLTPNQKVLFAKGMSPLQVAVRMSLEEEHRAGLGWRETSWRDQSRRSSSSATTVQAPQPTAELSGAYTSQPNKGGDMAEEAEGDRVHIRPEDIPPLPTSVENGGTAGGIGTVEEEPSTAPTAPLHHYHTYQELEKEEAEAQAIAAKRSRKPFVLESKAEAIRSSTPTTRQLVDMRNATRLSEGRDIRKHTGHCTPPPQERRSVRYCALLAVQGRHLRLRGESIVSWWQRLQTQRLKLSVLRGIEMKTHERDLWKQLWYECFEGLYDAQRAVEAGAKVGTSTAKELLLGERRAGSPPYRSVSSVSRQEAQEQERVKMVREVPNVSETYFAPPILTGGFGDLAALDAPWHSPVQQNARKHDPSPKDSRPRHGSTATTEAHRQAYASLSTIGGVKLGKDPMTHRGKLRRGSTALVPPSAHWVRGAATVRETEREKDDTGVAAAAPSSSSSLSTSKKPSPVVKLAYSTNEPRSVSAMSIRPNDDRSLKAQLDQKRKKGTPQSTQCRFKGVGPQRARLRPLIPRVRAEPAFGLVSMEELADGGVGEEGQTTASQAEEDEAESPILLQPTMGSFRAFQ